MRVKLMSFLAAAILVAVASCGRRAEAQVGFGGTFAGPHGVVSFNTGVPYAAPVYGNYGYRNYGYNSYRYGNPYAPSYRYGSGYRYGYARYSYPRSSYYPRRYRLRRFFVAFPFPHYVTQRVYFAPVDPYCGGYAGYDGY